MEAWRPSWQCSPLRPAAPLPSLGGADDAVHHDPELREEAHHPHDAQDPGQAHHAQDLQASPASPNGRKRRERKNKTGVLEVDRGESADPPLDNVNTRLIMGQSIIESCFLIMVRSHC